MIRFSLLVLLLLLLLLLLTLMQVAGQGKVTVFSLLPVRLLTTLDLQEEVQEEEVRQCECAIG